MLAKITLLTSLAFSTLYPFCFFLFNKTSLKQQFHHFHIGAPAVIGGVTLVFIWMGDLSMFAKSACSIWFALLFIVMFISWSKESLKTSLMVVPNISGLLAFIIVQGETLSPGISVGVIGVLSGLIYCASLYAMNLGHWYLNVHGLPIEHLRKAANALWICLGIRLLWDLVFIFSSQTVYLGEEISLFTYSLSMDGFLIWVAIFFGTIFPFISMFFVREILKLKNTQATTGVLYVVLCSVLLGDIAYKFYLIRYGVVL